jgi:hypothetical protein
VTLAIASTYLQIGRYRKFDLLYLMTARFHQPGRLGFPSRNVETHDIVQAMPR